MGALLLLVRTVSGAARRAVVIADLPFGSYETSAEHCSQTVVRFMKEAGAHAVKLEAGEEMLPQVELLTRSGIPVIAHIGSSRSPSTAPGGYRVRGRGGDAKGLVSAATALEAAGDVEAVEGKVHPADVVVRQRVDDEEAFLRLPQCQGAYRVVL
ncbi:3-methyl-2-oxobutanoate hydroxymethyltransferase [Streptomyces malaysiensis]|uniref:3-methyl-2-oxobutanoate hydroxymethyltransferase n=1 Tax=Streptomyces malaysiensis TaxID=92644 RepID=UPI00370FCF98